MNIEPETISEQANPQQLTARHCIDNLAEHWSAFQAVHNLNGWEPDAAYVLRTDRIADILLRTSSRKHMSLKRIKETATTLKKLSAKADGKIKNTECLDMVAKALGYASYDLAYRCRSVDHVVDNAWGTERFLGLMNVQKDVSSLDRKAMISKLYAERIEFNDHRDNKVRHSGSPDFIKEQRHIRNGGKPRLRERFSHEP